MASSTSSPLGRLSDKVAIITGSSSGIGRAIAIAYIREGAKVVCADLTPSARQGIDQEATATTLEILQKEGGEDRSIFVKADVSKGEDVQALVEQAVEYFGRLDIIVNNAGIAPPPSMIHETREDEWNQVMAVNARSVFLGSKYAIIQMLKQQPHPSGDRGWIINVASVSGLVGVAMTPSYSASKGAVAQTTKQVAVDYAKHRIHCNAICPGYTKTAVLADAFKYMGDQTETLGGMHPFRGLGEVDDIAGPAVFLACSDAKWITGILMAVDGGFTAQ